MGKSVVGKSVKAMVDLLDRVKDVVAGSRHAAYGKPEENHQRTAEAFAWYLSHRNIKELDESNDTKIYGRYGRKRYSECRSCKKRWIQFPKAA